MRLTLKVRRPVVLYQYCSMLLYVVWSGESVLVGQLG